MNLYKDIWILILKYLKDDLKSLSSFIKTSKYFNILANDNSLWQYFCNKLNKDEILEYKENTWKEIYRILSVIKTIETNDNSIFLKGNNRVYHFDKNIENQLKIYDTKQNDKLLNIINIYDDINNNYFIILSDDNRLFYINISNLNDNIEIYEFLLLLEKNDIIKNVICTKYYDFIIIKNEYIYKITMYNDNSKKNKLLFELDYNIIDINEWDCNYEFEYLDDNNKLQCKRIKEDRLWRFWDN